MKELPLDNSTAKNISFGVEGIFLGLLFFILILLGLNYFKIISLSSLHPALSFLPQKQQVVKNNTENIVNNTSKKSKGALIAEEKAKKVGYSVAWAGDTEDGTGRAILASSARNINGWVDKFGWQQIDLGNGVMTDYKAQGVFDRWQRIQDSKDYYIILKNPISKYEELKGRILIEDIKNKSTKKEDLINSNKTKLLIDNLNYSNNDSQNALKKSNKFSDLSLEKINREFKKGDIVTITVLALNFEDDKKDLSSIVKDENEIPLLITLTKRSF